MKDPLKPRDKIIQHMTRDGAVQENQTTGEAQSISGREAEQNPASPPQEASPVHSGGAAEKALNRLSTEQDAHTARKQIRKGRQTIRQGEQARQRPSSRLQFTDEERNTPELQKYINKSDKRADKLDAARDAVPKKRVLQKERIFDEASGKGKTKLRFDKVDKPAPKLKQNPASRPLRELAGIAHGKVHEVEGENAGVESGHKGEELAERGAGGAIRRGRRRHKLKPYRKAAKAERKAVKANANYLYQKTLHDNPALASGNPLNRFFQKQRLKRQYAQAVRTAKTAGGAAQTAKKTAAASAKAAKRAAAEAKRTGSFVVRHWKGCLIALAFLLLLALLMGGLQSCSLLFSGAGGGVAASSYQSEDADILAAEAAYCGLEAELQDYLDSYESNHSYDEYHYDLDEIEHDPYVLISILSALHEGAWTAGEVQGTLQMLFDKQYILTETVVKERRYYIETDTWTDEDGNTHTDSYRVYYDYYICTVTLENFNLSHVPVYIMGEEELSKYALYMSTLGNRPELFGSSEYIQKYITDGYTDYDIPASALEDETFAALMTEAEKYLGYPYVWGGSSPSTSFDCSGFVSWALTNSGVCNTGRLGAQGLYNISTPVSTPQPGDLVFFTGTYDTPGVSHVGIYVGNSMMIHCGDPISYSNLNSSYWQSHFYAYARPPYN